MSITTYAELQTAVKNWLERPDLADARVQEFIRLAEAYFQRKLRHREMEKRDTLSVSGRYTSLPSDYHQMNRVAVNGASGALRATTPAQMQDLQDSRGFTQGEPTHYAIVGSELEVYPTPGETYTLNLFYRRTLPALSDSNTTNWLLDRSPDLYLYGSLFHSAYFLDFDERLQAFAAPMDAAIRDLNVQSDESSYGGATITTGLRFYG